MPAPTMITSRLRKHRGSDTTPTRRSPRFPADESGRHRAT